MVMSSSSHHRVGGGGRMVSLTATALLFLLVVSSTPSVVAAAADDEIHHNVLAHFSDQLRCPYAEKWITKGPKQAAIELGLNSDFQQAHYVATSLDQKVAASSSLRGAGSYSDGARKLQQESGEGDASTWGGTMPAYGDTTCAIAVGPAGAAHQASYATGYRSDCPGTPAESSPYQWPLKWSADIYSQSMPFGTDNVIYESKSRVFYALDKNWKRSDTYYTRGVQRSVGQGPCPPGNLVDDPNNALIACRRDSDQRRTMIHRGSKMYFINWKENNSTNTTTEQQQPQDPALDDVSQIQDCTWLDLAIVGNIRPDWFLDNRGDDTDVQYLGNQHVYTNNMIMFPTNDATMPTSTVVPTPRLVKQWRKKDFASQYFTMSMLANPYNSSNTNNTILVQAENNTHWPIILNVPGEGFGDDFLQSYSNHRIMTSDEDDYFLLDEAFVASGGSCPEQVIPDFSGGGEGDGGAPPSFDNTTTTTATNATNTTTTSTTDGSGNSTTTFGPPVLETYIPSNLEVDERSWFSNVYTYSPVWEPPPMSSDSGSNASTGGGTAADAGMATTVAGLATISSCYDETKSAVYLKFAFDDIVDADAAAFVPLPWLALSYRKDETCYMSPIDGSDGELIFMQHNETTGESSVSFGSLPTALRASSDEALSSVYDSLVPLDQVPNGRYSQVSLSVNVDDDDAAIAPMTSVTSTSSSSSATTASSSSMVELEFYEQMSQTPTVMYMNYAIGMSPNLGYHKNRLCFEITSFPSCAVADAATTGSGDNDEDEVSSAGSSSSSSAAMTTTMHTTTMAVVFLSFAWSLFGTITMSS